MRQAENTPGAAVLAAAAVYNHLLSQMLDITDALAVSSEPWDSDKVRRLLDKRSEICQSIDRCAAMLDGLIPQARAACDEGILDRLDALLEESALKLTDVLQKQHECEKRAIKSLEECKAELSALGRRQKLKALYSPSAAAEKARFLDGRL